MLIEFNPEIKLNTQPEQYLNNSSVRMNTSADPLASFQYPGMDASSIRRYHQPSNSSTPVGVGANAQSTRTVAVGVQSSALDESATAVGAFSIAKGRFSTAVGEEASALAFGSTAVGRLMHISSIFGTGVGNKSSIASAYGTLVGQDSYIEVAENSTLVGQGSFISNGSHNTLVGQGSSLSTSDDSTLVGQGATLSGARSTGIGRAVNDVGFDDCILIGNAAVATASNQCVFGSLFTRVDEVFIGPRGVQSNSNGSVRINASGGLSADEAGGGLKIAGGRSTGAGIGGSITFQTAPRGASSSTLNILADRMIMDDVGNIVVRQTGIATNSTDKFFYLNSVNGTPTGTPTSYGGGHCCPIIIDDAAGKIWVYHSGGWHFATLT